MDEKYPVSDELNTTSAYLRFFGSDSGAAPEFASPGAFRMAITSIRKFTRSASSALHRRAARKNFLP
jgi:hypothetical protein